MDSDETKVEPRASKLNETADGVDTVNALEKTLEGAAKVQVSESDQKKTGITVKEQRAVEMHKESGEDKEDGDNRGAEAGNEDDKVIFN